MATTDNSLVLFDMDGTLTNPSNGITSCHQWAIEQVGVSVESADITALMGGVAEEMHRQLGVPEADVAESTRLYRERFAVAGWLEDTPYDGIPELLQQLADVGFTIGVATMKIEQFAVRIVERVGLSGLVTVVAGSDTGRTRLTKQSIIERAVSLLDTAPTGVAMVGDRHHDIEAARALGYTAIGAAWGFGSIDELIAANSHAIANTPAEVAELLIEA